MSKEIDDLKKAAGDYKTWALKARSKYIDLRLNNETEIRNLYIRLIHDISNELKKEGTAQIRKQQLLALIESLKEQQNKLEGQLTTIFEEYIKANAEAATEYAKAIDIKAVQEAGVSKVSASKVRNLHFSANQRAIETCWSRTHEGLYLSDRIWSKSKHYRVNMTEIIQSAVAEGQDCVKTARMLEKYVKTGKGTLAKQYPNMMKRMGSRVPEDICYEALRLARTEMTAAYGEATIQSAMVSPSCSGVKFILSGSHPKYDICDHICGIDEYGLGIGVYPIDKAPAYPFHPNCLCITLTVNENPSDFVDRLKRWDKNLGSEPGLEQWYQNVYKKSSMYIDDINKTPYNGIKEAEREIQLKESKKWLNAEFSTEKLYNKHFNKHGSQYGNITKEEYLQKSRELLAASTGEDIEGFKTEIGFIFKYNKSTNDFAIGRADGYISTLFKPIDAYIYWLQQIKDYKDEEE